MFFVFCLLLQSFAYKYNIEASQIGYKTLSLKNVDSLTIQFNQPYGLLLIHDWKYCLIRYDVNNIDDGSNFNGQMKFSYETQSKLVGLYLHETNGTVTFLTNQSTTLSISWIIFPKDCDLKYVQSVKDGGIQLKNSNVSDASTFCFYSYAPSPLQYSIQYDLSKPQLLTFIQSDYTEIFSLGQTGTFNQEYEEHSILKVSDYLNESLNFIEINATSLSKKDASQINYNDFISFDKVTFITSDVYTYKQNKNVKFIIFGTLGAVILILIIIFSIIGFRKRNAQNITEMPETDSSEEEISRPPTPEHIQIEQFQSDSADGDDQYFHNKDEFALDYEGYPQNDYNPSNVEYQVPKPVLLKTVLNEVNAKI